MVSFSIKFILVFDKKKSKDPEPYTVRTRALAPDPEGNLIPAPVAPPPQDLIRNFLLKLPGLLGIVLLLI
jgi:hypothetical protein